MAEYAYLEQVRNAAGFDATRTADAMALSLWPSRGHELHGFEVKVSRSDWRTELNNPEKAEVWTNVVDRWWIVAPKGIVPVDEVPAAWGLLEVVGEKLRTTKQAPLLTKRHDIRRSLLVPLLRAAGCALTTTSEEAALKASYEEGRQKGREDALRSNKSYEGTYTDMKAESDANRLAVREIENVLGMQIRAWKETDQKRAREVASALKLVLEADRRVEGVQNRVTGVAQQLEIAAAHMRDLARELA